MGTSLEGRSFLTQVYNRLIASDVKLRLMEQFDDEYPITVIGCRGAREEKIAAIPLISWTPCLGSTT